MHTHIYVTPFWDHHGWGFKEQTESLEGKEAWTEQEEGHGEVCMTVNILEREVFAGWALGPHSPPGHDLGGSGVPVTMSST